MLVFAATEVRAETTIYVGKHFEVRDHHQPTKYIFNGSTRVARITGSLSTNTRIQRFRLRSGWNLLSLAVTAPNALRQLTNSLSPILNSQSVVRWNQSTLTWLPVPQDETLPAGTVLWLRATSNATLALTGAYSDPTNRPITAGGSFHPSAGLEVLPLLGVRADVALWHFDSFSQRWESRLPAIPIFDPGFPEFLAPGAAVFVQADAPAELTVPDATLRLRYYHHDHLGSSSVMTDANGALAEETAFYPFGEARHEHRLRQIEESYKFTQKERDRESGLHYFEARYLAGTLSRFVTADPKYINPDTFLGQALASFLSDPQKINVYAYVGNNPLKYTDPTGLERPDAVDRQAFSEGMRKARESGASTGIMEALVKGVASGIGAIIGINTANAPTPADTKAGRVYDSLGYDEHAKNIVMTVTIGKATKLVAGKLLGKEGSSAAKSDSGRTGSSSTKGTGSGPTSGPASSWSLQKAADDALLERNTQYIMDQIKGYTKMHGRAPPQKLVNQYINEADEFVGRVDHLLNYNGNISIKIGPTDHLPMESW